MKKHPFNSWDCCDACRKKAGNQMRRVMRKFGEAANKAYLKIIKEGLSKRSRGIA